MGARLPFVTRPALASAALTLAILAGALWRSGGGIASPGALSASTGDGVQHGDIASHAALERDCAACHPPPWSAETTSTLCLDCHAEIRAEAGAGEGLHGRLAAVSCLECHTEHRGAEGALTAMGAFDHAQTDFPLTGAHERVECAECHGTEGFEAAPTACVDCHPEPRSHAGVFEGDCASCHSTSTWAGATFDHRFPLRHGSRRPVACETCHPQSWAEYTCYGCHAHSKRGVAAEHREEGIRDFADCMECHPTGREHERGGRGGDD